MVVLCRPEDGRARVWNIPGDSGQILHRAVKISEMYTKQHLRLEQIGT